MKGHPDGATTTLTSLPDMFDILPLSRRLNTVGWGVCPVYSSLILNMYFEIPLIYEQ